MVTSKKPSAQVSAAPKFVVNPGAKKWASKSASGAALAKFEERFQKQMGVPVTSKPRRPKIISTGSMALDYALAIGGVPTGRIVEAWGPEHAGKAGRATDHVLTPEGWRQYRYLVVGDEVIGSDGTPTRVLGIYPQGLRHMMKVTFSDGASIVVDEDHLWQVQSRKQVKLGSGTSSVYTTKELTQRRLRISSGWNYRIPLVHPVQYQKTDLALDPYLMGVFLANGSLTQNKPIFTTNDEGVVDLAKSRNPGLIFTEHESPEQTVRRWYVTASGGVEEGPMRALRILGLAGLSSREKFVHEEYLRASEDDRLLLLQGILDCDASSAKNRIDGHHEGNVRYFTRSTRLAHGVQEIVQSLGGTASIREYSARDGRGVSYPDGSDFVVSIVLPTSVSPFLGAHKKIENHQSRGHRAPVRSIVSVEAVSAEDAICIRVEAEDSLYVTEQHIVTHNTTMAMQQVAQCQRDSPDKMAAWVDMEQTFDEDWAVLNGVDMDRIWFYTPITAEDVSDAVKEYVNSGFCSIVVLDSVGGMISRMEMEKNADEATVGKVPGIVTRMVKQAAPVAASNGTILYVINQVRANIGGYGASETTGGGWALKHTTTIKLQVKKAGGEGTQHTILMDGKQVPVGHKIAVRVTKNKMAAYGTVAEIWLHNRDTEQFGPIGIDPVAEIFQFAKRLKLMGSGAGGNYEIEGEKVKGGEPKVMELLRAKPEMAEALRKKILGSTADKIGVQDEDDPDPMGIADMVDAK